MRRPRRQVVPSSAVTVTEIHVRLQHEATLVRRAQMVTVRPRRRVPPPRDELLDVLGQHGVVFVPSAGRVDLNRHEVVAVQGAAGRPDGPMEIARVVRRGFQHADWVFRPAQVIVTPPADLVPEGTSEASD